VDDAVDVEEERVELDQRMIADWLDDQRVALTDPTIEPRYAHLLSFSASFFSQTARGACGAVASIFLFLFFPFLFGAADRRTGKTLAGPFFWSSFSLV
jgi:hypothetical protein